MIKIEQTGVRPDGEALYRLIVNGRTVRENMSFDEAIGEIARRSDEEAETWPK